MLGKRWNIFNLGEKKILLLALLWILFGMAIFTIILADDPEIIVEWETETEFETVGFNLWRKMDPGEDFDRINEVIIPGSSDPASGNLYSYLDLNVERGLTYQYQLEDIDNNGTSTLHEEIIVAVPQTNSLFVLLALASVIVGVVLAAISVRWNAKSN